MLQSQLLDHLYQSTQQQLDEAVRDWQNRPAAALERKPAPGSWSAAQCLEHLNRYSRFYLPELEKALGRARVGEQREFHPGWLGELFYRSMKRKDDGTVAIKMKTPENGRPSDNPDGPAQVAEFIDHQEKLLELLERARQVDLGSVRVPLSLNPWMRLKLGDVLRFLVVHTERHRRQVREVL